MTEPNTQWTAIEQGVLVLPTTKYVIRYEPVAGLAIFNIYWGEKRVGGETKLKRAKALVAKHMTSMIEMGFEV